MDDLEKKRREVNGVVDTFIGRTFKSIFGGGDQMPKFSKGGGVPKSNPPHIVGERGPEVINYGLKPAKNVPPCPSKKPPPPPAPPLGRVEFNGRFYQKLSNGDYIRHGLNGSKTTVDGAVFEESLKQYKEGLK